MALIADTSGIVALFDGDDAFHQAACDALGGAGSVIVPAAIMPEVDYLLSVSFGTDAALLFVDNLVSGALSLDIPPFADLSRAREIIRQYADLELGYVDAAVMATAERLGIDRILTLDERHFRAVTPKSGKPLTLLPADAR